MRSRVYEYINNGVYSCGFATSQSSYEASVKKLYEHMEKVEEILSKQRYIAGDQLTEADVRLFMTLVRFDEVYNVYFKCNCKKVMEYPNMLNYTRELFQWPGGAMAIHLDHIKIH